MKVCGNVLERSSSYKTASLTGVDPYLPLPQEASGGHNLLKARSSYDRRWLSPNPIWLQGDGENE